MADNVLGNIFDFAQAGQQAAQGATQQFQQAVPGFVDTAAQAAHAQLEPLGQAARGVGLPLAHEAGKAAGQSAAAGIKGSVGLSTETVVVGLIGLGIAAAFGTAAYVFTRPQSASLNAFVQDANIRRGDRVEIDTDGTVLRGVVRTAAHYGDRDGWYVELTPDGGGYAYWKQGYDGGTIRKL